MLVVVKNGVIIKVVAASYGVGGGLWGFGARRLDIDFGVVSVSRGVNIDVGFFDLLGTTWGRRWGWYTSTFKALLLC